MAKIHIGKNSRRFYSLFTGKKPSRFDFWARYFVHDWEKTQRYTNYLCASNVENVLGIKLKVGQIQSFEIKKIGRVKDLKKRRRKAERK